MYQVPIGYRRVCLKLEGFNVFQDQVMVIQSSADWMIWRQVPQVPPVPKEAASDATAAQVAGIPLEGGPVMCVLVYKARVCHNPR